MSLRVWLPLNGTLTNKGDYLQSITSTGASISNSGKIGKCYSMAGASNNAIKGVFKCNTTNMSFCIWVKFNSLSGAHLLDCRINDTDGYQPMYVEPSRIQVGNGATSFSDVSYSFTTGVWYHIAVVHSSSDVKVYVNGALAGTTTASKGYNYNRELPFYIGSRFTGANPLNGLVNDFRIYDHSLSASEVKTIARGLFIYYPLDNNGFNSLNLITDIDTSFISYSNGATTLFVNQMNSGTEEIVASQAGMNKCLHIRGAGSSNRVYRTWPLSQNTTYTISAYFYSSGVSSAFGAFHTELYGGGYNWEEQTVNYTTPGQWQRLSITLTPTADTTLYYFFYTNTNLDFYIKNIKLEIGSVTTPWNYGLTEADKTTVGIREWPVHYDFTIYRESDGSKWLHLVHHNNPGSTGLFSSSDSFATGVYKSADKWYDAELAIARAQTYEFMVKQKATSDAAEVKYRWIQNVSPLTATYNDVIKTKVTRITSSGYTDGGFGGLWRMNSNARMVIANDTSSNWYGACGSWTEWSSQLPGYPNTAISNGYFDLYMRINVAEEFDKSGMGNDAIVNTTGMSYSGNTLRNNSCTCFNGSNNYITIPSLTLDMTKITFSIWGKWNSFNNWSRLFDFGQTVSGGGYDLLVANSGTSGSLMVAGRGSGGSTLPDTSVYTILTNTWYHIAITISGTTCKVYINGELIKTITFNNTFNIATPMNLNYLGKSNWAADALFNGYMSDFRVYASVLSDSDIKALYLGNL